MKDCKMETFKMETFKVKSPTLKRFTIVNPATKQLRIGAPE
jgi:hypothetical protein